MDYEAAHKQAYLNNDRSMIIHFYCCWASKFLPLREGYYGT